MNRLQKKCLVAAAGTHFLVVVVLLCSGFIPSKPKPDDSQVLDVIPAKLIDAALQSGVRNAQPPPPAPPTPPANQVEPPQPPTPAPPPPEVKHIEPPKPVEPVKPPEPTEPDVTKPVEHAEPKPKPLKHVIDVAMKPVVHKSPPKPYNREAEAEARAEKAAEKAAERAAQRAQAAKVRAMQSALNTIKESISSSMQIEMPGTGSVSYANYASVVKSIYEREWRTPEDASNDEANTRVSVTINRDGSVISAHILTPCGDPKVDASVQQTLERVTFIAPFPDGSTEKEKEFIIIFNLKLKRMLG
jgi:TonB family protein